MVFDCFGRTKFLSFPTTQSHLPLLSEKESYSRYDHGEEYRLAEKMVFTIHNDKKSFEQLRTTLAEAVGETSWWSDAMAKRTLDLLETALAAGASMGPAMKEAFDKAMESAKNIKELGKEFAKEHPVITGVVCVVLALGILYLLVPSIIELLGFTEYGPAAGSFASRWQSLYGARVPVGSVFSYLQRLGMRWNGGVVNLVARL